MFYIPFYALIGYIVAATYEGIWNKGW